MISKKDLVIAILATFCLTSALFMIATTRSAEYDPWVDLDGDGKITIYDVVQMTRIYGTEGDPTRNVNITNWPDWIINYDRIIDLKEIVYPEMLTLIGGCCINASGIATPVLVMQSSLHPKLGWGNSPKYGPDQPTYMTVLNYTFIQIELPQSAFNITGNVVSCVYLKYQASSAFPVWWKGVVSFGIVRTDESNHEINSVNISEMYEDHGASDYFQGTLIHSLPNPITINTGERLYLKISLDAKWDGEDEFSWIEFQIVVDAENDLMLQIPITTK